jgi:hypothetical protein
MLKPGTLICALLNPSFILKDITGGLFTIK